MARDVPTKLSAARARLILDKPFLGALVLRLPLRAGDSRWCPTTATDARALYYNPEYIDGLSLEQTQFMLAHEAMHCALSHFARRQHRVRHRWDLACDLAVNPLLAREGLQAPPGALLLDQFAGMTAEEIYPYLDELSDDQRPLDEHLYDAGDGDGQSPTPDAGTSSGEPESGGEGAARPPPLTDSERDRLGVQWRQRLAGAAQQALQAGKLGAAMARLVDHLLQPKLPWRALLARYLAPVARDDYSYSRPSRREGQAILPSLRSSQVDLVIVVDVSGSISDGEIGEFISEINGLKGQLRARVMLHACDAELAPDGPWVCEPWEPFRLPRGFSGGGGTRFTPVFDWLAAQGRRPDVLVYFTDAQGEFPAESPDFPVIWLVKGRAPVPWGQRVQLN